LLPHAALLAHPSTRSFDEWGLQRPRQSESTSARTIPCPGRCAVHGERQQPVRRWLRPAPGGPSADEFQQENGNELRKAPTRAAAAVRGCGKSQDRGELGHPPGELKLVKRSTSTGRRRSRSGSKSWRCRPWSSSIREWRCPVGRPRPGAEPLGGGDHRGPRL